MPLDAPTKEALVNRYWRANLTITLGLLFIWAFVSFGCGILFADVLDDIHLFGSGYPLGFWFAQQGSIIVFVFLILIYAIAMNALDRKHKREMDEFKAKGGQA
ncbi:DUF4212 domain-containing protein [Cerasicoccus fimbriatus]|uniref:DUF4212 domain-containing protein n=1 Tax=Cerasicoccus fimbriatus TaxID=3014554 RepID=UPI0022B5C90A|nr:DUF4212 domain-containing protein [Cerasicoccus sp. TK19100]